MFIDKIWVFSRVYRIYIVSNGPGVSLCGKENKKAKKGVLYIINCITDEF